MITNEKITIGEGGELLSAEINIRRTIKAEEYCQLYIKDDCEFYRLTQAEIGVLSVCIYLSAYYDESYGYPGNIIHYDGNFRDVVVRRTNLSIYTVKSTLANLVKKGMLIKDDKYRAVYYLNPQYFFKGTISSRTQLIKKTVEYTFELEKNKKEP